jgi:putative transposase
VALKKARILNREQRRLFIEKDNASISIRRQCELLGYNRSNLYYQKREKNIEFEDQLRKVIDLRFIKEAWGVVVKMMNNLRRFGYSVDEKLVRRLMRTMNLLAIYPKPNLSKPHPEYRIYPYLLKKVAIVRSNQVFCTDVTYI